MLTQALIRLIAMSCVLIGCGGGPKEELQPTASLSPSQPTYPEVTQSTDPDLLFQLVYGGYYSKVIPGQYLGDASSYFESRFPVYRSIPEVADIDGGIRFNGVDSFVAIQDGFMAGVDFVVEFFVYVESDGALTGSNWATSNPGDWLLMVEDGRLSLMVESVWTLGQTQLAKGVRHSIQIIKSGAQVQVFLNNEIEISAAAPLVWRENGSPLVIGGNAYDRLNGMNYFKGVIGDFKIRRFL